MKKWQILNPSVKQKEFILRGKNPGYVLYI